MAKSEINYYYDAFTRGLTFANDAAIMLKDCLENFNSKNMKEQLDKMHTIEHNADGIKHEMMERLVKEFLPPIEREDIVQLSHIIDDVTDSIEDILRGMYMYNITTLRPEVASFVSVITRSSASLIDVAKELPNFRKSPILHDKIIEINALEEEGDRLYTEAMRNLYENEKDPIAVLSWTIMFDRLEKCCDCCENVADMVEQVIMKNS